MTEKEQPSTTQPEQAQAFHYPAEDEIGFEDLLDVLIRKKILILAFTTICTLLGIFYAQSITPIYEATIAFLEPRENFLPPLPRDIAKELPGWTYRDKTGELLRDNPSPFALFLSKVASYKFKKIVFQDGNFLKKFYGDNNFIDLDNAVLQIHNSIKITKEKADPNLPDFDRPVYLAMEGENPEAMSEFLTALAETAKEIIAMEIIAKASSIINSKEKNISFEMDTLHLIAKEKIEKEVFLFSNSLSIATNLSLKNYNFDKFSNSKLRIGVVRGNDQDRWEVQDTSLPIWFLYGEEALQQELMILKLRKNGEPILGMAEQEMALKKYQAVDVSSLKIKVATISQPSVPPTNPIEPNKPIIISIGMGLGLLIGILLALVRNSMDHLRQKHLSDNSI